MSVPTEIKHIVKTPGFYGGKPCIDDYKIAVHDIAVLHNQHYSPEQIIAEHYPELTLSQVYAALLYYYEHQAEIDTEIAEDDAEIKACASQDSSRVRRKIHRL
ncbi:MAG TPA: DUF433 domain-containing protein [Ktedonobacterales bacterium]|jgi:uncharacterized protein (DUF433 family)